MSEEKKGVRIDVEEIDNGFIVSIENTHGIRWEKKFCAEVGDIIKQVKSWLESCF